MFKQKSDPKKMDLDILDQIIGKCEDKMVSPFKKKAAVAVEVKPEEGSEGEEAMESPDEEKAEGSKPDLSDMDLEDLLKMYAESHGK